MPGLEVKGAGGSVLADSGSSTGNAGIRARFKKQNGEFDLDITELEVPLRSQIEMFRANKRPGDVEERGLVNECGRWRGKGSGQGGSLGLSPSAASGAGSVGEGTWGIL